MKDMIGWYEWGIWMRDMEWGYGMRIWMSIWMSIWNEGSFSYKIHRMTLE